VRSNVSFWHKADIPTVFRDVRFRGYSGHREKANGKCPQDLKRDAAAAWRRFVTCVEALPPESCAAAVASRASASGGGISDMRLRDLRFSAGAHGK
jgi:hypothetical protein